MRDIEKYTEDYNQKNFEDYQIIYRRKKIIEIIQQYTPRHILEIGCGMEPLFQYINFSNIENYTIVEPSKIFYENACRLSKNMKNVECFNEYFSASKKLKVKGFDFIICSSLLHEIEQPIDFLESIAHICNKKTIVHINVPNAKSFHRLLAVKMGMISQPYEMSERNILFQQNMVYDIDMLETSVKKVGFLVVDSGSYFIKPFSHSQMFSCIEGGIINEKVLDGLYELEGEFSGYGSEIYVNCRLEYNE